MPLFLLGSQPPRPATPDVSDALFRESIRTVWIHVSVIAVKMTPVPYPCEIYSVTSMH